MANNSNQTFLGNGWGFPPSFSKAAKGVKMVCDETDVRESIEILLSTFPGERVMQPTYGANMEKLLFEPLNTTLKTYMKDLIKDAILYHEPRVDLKEIELEANPLEGLIEISVDYIIRGTNTRNNIVYPFYLNEGVNL